MEKGRHLIRNRGKRLARISQKSRFHIDSVFRQCYTTTAMHITLPGRAARTTEKALLASFLFFFSLIV